MNCMAIRRELVSGRVPAGPALDAHLATCPHCSVLLERQADLGRRLARAVVPDVEPVQLFVVVRGELERERGLRARLRALPTRSRLASLVGTAAALFAWQFVLWRRPDFETYAPGAFWAVALALGLALVLGASSLLRAATAPLASRAHRVAFSLLVLPALVALLVPLGAPETANVSAALGSPAAASWGTPGACFAYGAVLVAPFPLLVWLLERRDLVPVGALVTAGGLSGIAANLLLHAHCPSVHAGHLLLGHATTGVAWALGLSVLLGRARRRNPM